MKTSRKAPIIKIDHSASISRKDLKELCTEMANLSPNIELKRQESGSYGAWEWVIPAAVGIYLGKGLVDGFLKELGADAAKGLKKAIAKVFKKGKDANVRYLAMSDLENLLKQIKHVSKDEFRKLVARSGVQGASMSITFELQETILFQETRECTVKFVFPSQLDDATLLKSLDDIPSMLLRAKANALARVKLDKRVAELLSTDEKQGMALMASKEYGDMPLDQILVCDPEVREWVDVVAKQRAERDAYLAKDEEKRRKEGPKKKSASTKDSKRHKVRKK